MVERPGRVADKVVLISGTGGGQGRAAALAFAREGAVVVGCDIVADAAETTVRLASEEGLHIRSLAPLDLTDRAQVDKWMQYALDECGGIDVLYNNASRTRFAAFPEMTAEDYRFTLDYELDVVWHCSQSAWPHLVERGKGAIINIGSIAGLIGAPGFPMAAHSAGKGAVIALTRQLAAEGAAHGIRVNAISPGVINSPPVKRMAQELGEAAPFTALIRNALNGAPGEPEDVAHAALYLASDEARWVTGINLVIDGGATVLAPPR
jgi:meso-butanediol dehydrogenase / (S,S)-butanediol dehydrogenase / diacetyl reductase